MNKNTYPKMVKHVAKRPRTVSANKFYAAAKSGYRVGKQLYKAYKSGKKVYDKVNQIRNGRSKSSSSGSVVASASVLQSISQHNDWASRKPVTIYIGKKNCRKTVGNYYLDHSSSGIQTADQGRQINSFGGCKLTKDQLNGNTSTNINNQDTQFATDPFLLNPYSTGPTNSIYTGPAPAVSSNDTIYIKTIESQFRIVSLNNIPQRVKFFVYLNKRTSSTGNGDLNQVWADAISGNNYLQASSAAGPATIADTVIVPGTLNRTDIGVVPHSYSHFRKYFKLLHSDQFVLQPGDQMTKKIKYVVNKVISKKVIEMLSDDLYVPGYSIIPYFIVDAGLVGLETALDAGTVRCAPGSCKVGYLNQDRYTFGALPATRWTINRLEIGYNQVDTTSIRKIVDAEDSGVVQEVE